VVEEVAAAPAGPFPAWLLRLEAVQGSEGVAEALLLQAADQGGLGLVPALAALLGQGTSATGSTSRGSRDAVSTASRRLPSRVAASGATAAASPASASRSAHGPAVTRVSS
jgi:hypothetical protein